MDTQLNNSTPNLPAFPGLTFRNYQGEDDLLAMLALSHKLEDAGLIEPGLILADLQAQYRYLVNCDPFKDVVLGFSGDEISAILRCTWEIEIGSGKHIFYAILSVTPALRGTDLFEQLVHWAEEWAVLKSASLESHPEDLVQIWANGRDPLRRQKLEGMGYRPRRFYYKMSRPLNGDLPDYPLPEGIEVRPTLPSTMRKVWDASMEAFQDEWGATQDSPEWYESYIRCSYCQPALWQVAWQGDEVVGSVMNYIDENENEKTGQMRGYTEGITVRRQWRGKGIAKALICRSMRMHQALNMQEVALGVDTENPTGALHLYESLGYRQFRLDSVMMKLIADIQTSAP